MGSDICRCGVISGGHRDPRPGCPMHAEEDRDRILAARYRAALEIIASRPENGERAKRLARRTLGEVSFGPTTPAPPIPEEEWDLPFHPEVTA